MLLFLKQVIIQNISIFWPLLARIVLTWVTLRQNPASNVYQYIFLWRYSPTRVMTSSFLMRFLDHTKRRTTVGRTPLDEWSSPPQRPLPENTQHSQQTNTYAPGRIRTHNLSRRAAANLRFRPHGHWYRQMVISMSCIFVNVENEDHSTDISGESGC